MKNAGWSKYAPEKFGAARQSFLEFGHAVFSEKLLAFFFHQSADSVLLERKYSPDVRSSDFGTSSPPAFVMNETPANATANDLATNNDITNTSAQASAFNPENSSTTTVHASASTTAGGTAFATASITTPEVQLSATASSPPQDLLPSNTAPNSLSSSSLTPPNTSRTGPPPAPNLSSQATAGTDLPGTGPGQANGLFVENAGIDHDQEDWFPTLKRLWPALQQDLGPDWKLCLARFVDYERHRGFSVSLLLLSPHCLFSPFCRRSRR